MSTIDITPAVTTRLRLTMRGRRVLAAIAAVPAAIALGVAILGGGAALASHASGAPVHYETVTVHPGDTLWGIAQEVAPRDDPRDVVDAIVNLNALDQVTLVPGQRIAIPTQYTGE
jgi:nucleoid-associated protein YgaU